MMSSIKRILIIEDEEVNAQRLQRILLKIRPGYTVVTILSSIEKSVEWLSKEDGPDLIFMDIRLSDGSSFEIFNLIEVKSPVVFTTAYDEYALKAFKYNSIDYLLKPIECEELEAAIIQFEQFEKSSTEQQTVIKNLLESFQMKEYRTRFLLPHRDAFILLNVNEIAYFYSELGVTFSISYDGTRNIISHTLETLEQQLDPKYFFRANRQYIIHINSIVKVHNYFNSKLKLDVKQCQEKIVVSRLKATALKQWLDY
ncbi:LytR/AlgR family response regulator transcription factor [Chryseobacterium salviniae]|uniref:LytTR family DNA-binding domain-containing protein n=1 Tax=Chryseobacterium salviniae TaxID=3101750 RepID=A0ABU6HQK0_9FLAO|nr:LytTR family DNA-binding domain-containing protein [Chryseobacterium sp. T9W2-O]MEC3875330.1 LytTR family DNA-binding domain-containing protein [Chryseobacterium sp. T9W2-O]